MSYYFNYILDTYSSVYSFNSEISIGHGSSDADINIIDLSSTFFDSEISQPDLLVWKNWNGKNLPFLFSNQENQPILSEQGNKILINFDIVGSAFFFLSSWQEFHSSSRDQHGRFPYNLSFQYRHGVIAVPLVNYYFDILSSAIEKLTGEKPKRKCWPEASFAVSLTHDIDKINSGWIEGGLSALKKGRFFSTFKLCFKKLLGKDIWDNLDEIIELERRANVCSTFFFLTENTKGNSDYSFNQVKPCFSEIEKANSEVALHGSLGSCHKSEILFAEKNRFPSSIEGNRFHYLKFEPSTYVSNIEKAGLAYDSSLGYAEHIGFRSGYCFPYKLFNLGEKKVSTVVEIPLLVMDATLNNPNYMGRDPNKMDKIEKVIVEVQAFGGVVSILWHNNYFSEYKYEGWKKVYTDLIEKFTKQKAVFLTCGNIKNQID